MVISYLIHIFFLLVASKELFVCLFQIRIQTRSVYYIWLISLLNFFYSIRIFNLLPFILSILILTYFIYFYLNKINYLNILFK